LTLNFPSCTLLRSPFITGVLIKRPLFFCILIIFLVVKKKLFH
jgi:hypothetical protein